MGKKISKRTREQAAVICQMIASSIGTIDLDEAAESIGADQEAVEAALDVSFDEEWYRYRTFNGRWASAESALRTGWVPQ